MKLTVAQVRALRYCVAQAAVWEGSLDPEDRAEYRAYMLESRKIVAMLQKEAVRQRRLRSRRAVV